MKMKAAVMMAANKPLEVREVELAEPKAGEVLVKVLATGVCHSDLNAAEDSSTPTPSVLGHEGAGEVMAIGPNVSKCKVGDRVILNWVPYCGTCSYCRRGKVNLCEAAFGPMFDGTLMDGTSRLSLDGGKCYHYSLLSTFAEYTVVPEMSCVVVPKAMPMAQACIIGCGVATGFGASARAAQVSAGSSVAIFGLGGVGVNAVIGAKIAGAAKIIACDVKPDNLGKASAFGATHTINTAEVKDVPAAIKDLTDGIGADFVIDCTGNTKAGSIAWQSGCKGSVVVVIGAYPSNGELALPAGGFHRVSKTLKGSFYGGVNPFYDFPVICNLYLEGKYDLDSQILDSIKLEDINKIFEVFHSPTGKNMGRYVVNFS